MAARNAKGRKAPRRGFWQRMRGNFLTGLVVVAPTLLTIYLIWTVITFVDGKIVPWVPAAYNPSTYIGVDIPGFGVLVFILFTAVVGYLTKNLFGRQLVHLAEDWVERMPIVRSIYNALKQIVETVLSQSQTSFKQACLIEYPRKGLWAIAFISTETRGEIAEAAPAGEPMLSVFLPTTPNPTSGFLLFVPRSQVVILDMTVEEAAKLVISAGLVTPPTAQERAAAARRAAPRTAARRGGKG
ncbi:DUF502 domain-containing protein [Oceanicella actignis]|uniref:Uncharacterized membrane protein n=1 Tax=Oceanicella actignis TaxID=1189325 RepID=A0A1M7S816_9RHOB|nr:DUF502 domain-containing protein [Oceanicella actignis]SET32253.1 Uncharacterized membrane protein [Oceanicella actignis]SHN54799.1 Uncharacterized membrane protein [Oceanicella actignis]